MTASLEETAPGGGALDRGCDRQRPRRHSMTPASAGRTSTGWRCRSSTRSRAFCDISLRTGTGPAARRARDARVQLGLLSNEAPTISRPTSIRIVTRLGGSCRATPSAPPAGRLHTRACRTPRRRLHPSAHVHRIASSPRRCHLHEGPLPGGQRGPAAGRAGPGRNGHGDRKTLPRVRYLHPEAVGMICASTAAIRCGHDTGAAPAHLRPHGPPGPDLLRQEERRRPDSSCRPPTGSPARASPPDRRDPADETGRCSASPTRLSDGARHQHRRCAQNPDIHGYMID